jgi:hypothetical protein
MGQRRCERAIADLKEAGLVEVKQPRRVNEHGEYVGLRAIRVITEQFFDFLDLGPMLRRERARASEMLRRKAQKANRKLTQLMRRLAQGVRGALPKTAPLSKAEAARRESLFQRWNELCSSFISDGLPLSECRRRTNAELGLPPEYSPANA